LTLAIGPAGVIEFDATTVPAVYQVVLTPYVFAAQLAGTPAEPEVRPAAHLHVESSPSCASRGDLIARVLSRAPHVRFVEDDAALYVRVKVDATQPSAVVSEVTLARGGEQPSTRRVVAASCTEASDAIAVIIAIAIAKSASGLDSGEGGSTAAPADTAGRTDAARRVNPAGASAAGQTPARKDSAAVPDGFATTPSSGLGSRPRFALQLAGQSFVAPAPGVMLGVGAYAMAGLDTASTWSPALVLGAARAWRTGVEARGGTASFTLDAVMLDVCALRFAFASVETRLCASVLGGRLSAEGSNTLNAPGVVARPFWVVGGSALFTRGVGAHFEVSARLAVGVNLVRDEFEFAPVVFHEVPAVTIAPSVGFGARFP
jgi:hypothetical protein